MTLLSLRHYVEGVCADSASFDIPAAHLAGAIQEAQEAFEIRANEEEEAAADHAKDARRDALAYNAGAGAHGDKDKDKQPRAAMEYRQLKGILRELEGRISAEAATASGAAAGPGGGGGAQGGGGGAGGGGAAGEVTGVRRCRLNTSG